MTFKKRLFNFFEYKWINDRNMAMTSAEDKHKFSMLPEEV
jgi:hypothetical protein